MSGVEELKSKIASAVEALDGMKALSLRIQGELSDLKANGSQLVTQGEQAHNQLTEACSGSDAEEIYDAFRRLQAANELIGNIPNGASQLATDIEEAIGLLQQALANCEAYNAKL